MRRKTRNWPTVVEKISFLRNCCEHFYGATSRPQSSGDWFVYRIPFIYMESPSAPLPDSKKNIYYHIAIADHIIEMVYCKIIF